MNLQSIKSLAAYLFICMLLPAALAAARDSASPNVNAEDAAALLHSDSAGVYVLDVRTPGEFAQGHVPGAHNLDFFAANFRQAIRALPRNKTILLYCRTGRRSASALRLLREAGYGDVAHMHEGFEGWKAAGLPISAE